MLFLIPIFSYITSKVVFKYFSSVPYAGAFLLYYTYFAIGFVISYLDVIGIKKLRCFLTPLSIVVLLCFAFFQVPSGIYASIMVVMLMSYIPISVTLNKLFKYPLFVLVDSTSYGVYIFHMIISYVIYELLIANMGYEFIVSNKLWLSSVVSLTTIPLSIFVTVFIKKFNILKI